MEPEPLNEDDLARAQSEVIVEEEFSEEAKKLFGIEDAAKNFIKDYTEEQMSRFKRVNINGKFDLQNLSEDNEKLLVLLQTKERESYGIYFPIKANYRFNDSRTTIFDIKTGLAKVHMNGKIRYYIDEDGDLGMDLYDDRESNMIKKTFILTLNKIIWAYTLGV